MNDELLGTVFSAWTVVVCVLFIGIAAWVYNGRNRANFEAASRLPLDDDDDPAKGVSPHG